MVLDILGSDDIEVDGDMFRPSDPTPNKRKCARVSAFSIQIGASTFSTSADVICETGIDPMIGKTCISKEESHWLACLSLPDDGTLSSCT